MSESMQDFMDRVEDDAVRRIAADIKRGRTMAEAFLEGASHEQMDMEHDRAVYEYETLEALTHRARGYMDALRERVMACGSCGEDTCGEMFMLHDEVWLQANGRSEGMLCVGCVEDKLGRPLHKGDFNDAPINEAGEWNSDRLNDALTRDPS